MATVDVYDPCTVAERELYDLLYEFYDICENPGDYDMTRAARKGHRRSLKVKIRAKMRELHPLRLLRDDSDPQVVSVVTGVRRA